MTDLIQNFETPSTNPLDTSPKFGIKAILNNPKYLLLSILGLLIVLLLIANLVAKIFDKAPVVPIEKQNVITPTPLPQTINKVVPTEYQNRFDEIDKEIRKDLEFIPPAIDTQIGL